MKHEIKIWPQFYEAVISGAKNFEIRKNDRGFNAGDTVVLKEFDPEYLTVKSGAFGMQFNSSHESFTGRSCTRKITYVLSGTGIEHGYVVFGMEEE